MLSITDSHVLEPAPHHSARLVVCGKMEPASHGNYPQGPGLAACRTEPAATVEIRRCVSGGWTASAPRGCTAPVLAGGARRTTLSSCDECRPTGGSPWTPGGLVSPDSPARGNLRLAGTRRELDFSSPGPE